MASRWLVDEGASDLPVRALDRVDGIGHQPAEVDVAERSTELTVQAAARHRRERVAEDRSDERAEDVEIHRVGSQPLDHRRRAHGRRHRLGRIAMGLDDARIGIRDGADRRASSGRRAS